MAEMPTTATETTTAPLLTPRQGTSGSPSAGRGRSTTTLAMLLGRFSGRRGASMLVRETATRELEERRAEWGYSLPAVALDITWNLAFVVVSVVMLFWTAREKPNVPLRAWIFGYALQCALHVMLVWSEYRKRNRRVAEDETTAGSGSSVEHTEDGDRRVTASGTPHGISFSDAKGWETLSTMYSCVWWMLGFYLVVSANEILLHSAPRLYWLTLAFLALDVFFTIICVIFACLVGIAVCCCFPCIIAFLYFIVGQEGASETDINVLPKYRFEVSSDEEQPDVGAGRMVPIATNGQDFSVQRVLLTEDADCCICLCPYEDRAELLSLPCNHHFHGTCIGKWLKMNATCPLCKHNIKRNEEQV